jgi:hypothetical protein
MVSYMQVSLGADYRSSLGGIEGRRCFFCGRIFRPGGIGASRPDESCTRGRHQYHYPESCRPAPPPAARALSFLASPLPGAPPI